MPAYLAPSTIGGRAYLAPLNAPVPGSTVTGVIVSPSTAVVAGGGTVDFDWVVQGTNSPSQAGTWTTTLGIINANGVLTAPAATSMQQPGTVTFTSAQDPTKSGSATFMVPAIGTELVVSYRFIPLARDYNTKTIHYLG